MKKTFCYFFLSLLPLFAQANPTLIGDIYYNLSGTKAEVTNPQGGDWDFSSYYTGTVDIPSTVSYNGTTYTVTAIGNFAFFLCNGLTSVTIPNTVTSIDVQAFGGCGLTSINIPNSVTSIGVQAFSRCNGLTSVTIPESVTSIGFGVFSDCRNLNYIVVENGNSVYDSRNDCNAIIETQSNTLIQGCINTNIPNDVTSIGRGAFSGCSGLNSINIPNSVTSIGKSAFYYCSSLKTIVVESGNTVYDSRNNCNAIIEIQTNTLIQGCKNTNIPNSVTSIGSYAFSGCEGLTSVTIPYSVTSIDSYAFTGCYGLTSITIPNSVTSIGEGAFSGCIGLTSVTIPDRVTSIENNTFADCSSLTSVSIPNSVTSIGISAFSSCSSLTSFSIPNNVTSIGNYAFSYCYSLSSITIPNSVTSINDCAFEGCSALTDVYCLPLEVPATATNAFDNSNIENVTLHIVTTSYNAYKNAIPWKNFRFISCDIPEPCATPVISYVEGKILFTCETEGVEFKSNISSADFGEHNDSEIDLCVAYNISVYATKKDYSPSENVTATLCWIDAETVEQVVTGTVEIAAVPVLVKSRGGVITVEGVGNNTPVSVYTTDGVLVGSASAVDHTATIPTSLTPGTVAIVDLGKKAVKVIVK